MKIKSHILSIISIATFCLACSSTKTIRYSITIPPQIYLPENIQSIGILNRSRPNEETKTANKIDEILSQEGFGLDKKAANTCINEMNYRFQINDVNTQILDTNLFNDIVLNRNPTPAPISWDTLNEIGNRFNVDAIIVLEYLDTRSSINTSVGTPANVNIPFGGGTLNTNLYTVNIQTTIEFYWRLYDLKSQKIIEEYKNVKYVNSSASGISVLAAYKAIQTREAEVMNQCKIDVSNFCSLFKPFQQNQYRKYYCRGSKTLKKGARMMETRNIEKAIETWQSENSEKSKALGRATYNQAIAYDFLQKPDTALIYARKSYEEYGEKKGKSFAIQLENRKRIITNSNQP